MKARQSILRLHKKFHRYILRAIGSEAAGATQAAPLLKAREAWPLYVQTYMDPKYRPEIFCASCRNTFDRCASFIQGRSHQYGWSSFNKTTFAFPALVDERLRISSARSHHFNSYGTSGSSCCVLCCRVTPFR